MPEPTQSSLQDRIMEVVRDYTFQRLPTLHAAFENATHDGPACCCADAVINLAQDIEIKVARFTEPRSEILGTYDDREYHADQKVA